LFVASEFKMVLSVRLSPTKNGFECKTVSNKDNPNAVCIV
jgi:hypothetical protein